MRKESCNELKHQPRIFYSSPHREENFNIAGLGKATEKSYVRTHVWCVYDESHVYVQSGDIQVLYS